MRVRFGYYLTNGLMVFGGMDAFGAETTARIRTAWKRVCKLLRGCAERVRIRSKRLVGVVDRECDSA